MEHLFMFKKYPGMCQKNESNYAENPYKLGEQVMQTRLKKEIQPIDYTCLLIGWYKDLILNISHMLQ